MAFSRIRASGPSSSTRRSVPLTLERLEERTLLSSSGLDPSFGTGGRVLSDFGISLWGATGVARQPDGKLVVSGSAGPNDNHPEFIVARYLADGSPDLAFGPDGKGFTQAGAPIGYAHGMALQADGKIVVVGETGDPSIYAQVDFALVRYNTDGTLDTSFGNGGNVVTRVGTGSSVAYAAALEPDGKLLVAGAGGGIALARYDPDGTLDPTFGTGGLIVTNAYDVSGPVSLALERNGKVVVLWTTVLIPEGNAPAFGPLPTFQISSTVSLARYNSDGGLDAGFGDAGRVDTGFDPFSSSGTSVVIQPDHKIVVAGIGYASDFLLLRYNDDGSLDTTFGNGGKAVSNFPADSGIPASVALEADGKIVVAGSTSGAKFMSGPNSDFAVSRYNPDGSPDLTFGTRGQASTPVGPGVDFGNSMLLQPDGSIVMAGGSELGTGADYAFALVRYLPDASVETGPDPAHAFVVHAYEDLLGREPEAFGLGAWTALLNQGMSQTDVARGILSSVEYRMREVEGLYHHLLHRDADSAGLHAFVQYLATNSLEQAEAVMLGSPEYLQSRADGDNNRFLAALYEDVLGRAIDPAGRSVWGQALTRGAKRAEVAAMIFSSSEYRKDLAHDLYQRFLHRSADPNGLGAFLTALGQGARDEDLIARLLASPEYARWQ